MCVSLSNGTVASIAPMVEYHLKVKPIVYKYVGKDENTGESFEFFMVKSIKQDSKSYNVVNENDEWVCDCPSFKFRSGTDVHGHCKHIRLVRFLLDKKVEIEVISGD